MTEAPNVLIVGNGAREHALGWKLTKDSPSKSIFFAPGNGGTSQIGTNQDFGSIDIDRIVDFAADNRSYVIVGPEKPLELGLVNALSEASVESFGPKQEAAKLESSKAWAVEFMQRHGIPHPTSEVFEDYPEASEFLDNIRNPYDVVIKADGLADGKAVFLPETVEEAQSALRRIMVEKEFGNAGNKVLLQQRLYGTEASAIALVSNEVVLLPMARDYKRAYDEDVGPNTGGMGAYSPTDFVTKDELSEIYHKILLPTKQGMISEGLPFKGALYAQVIITDEGPQVLEYNVRFGDPETQVQMRRLDSNLLRLLKSTSRGTLTPDQIKISPSHAVGVVVSSSGYPGKYEVGKEVIMPENLEKDIVIFHGGTKIDDGVLKTSGGRVLTVTATGVILEQARNRANTGANKIKFEGMQKRNDIARI